MVWLSPAHLAMAVQVHIAEGISGESRVSLPCPKGGPKGPGGLFIRFSEERRKPETMLYQLLTSPEIQFAKC